MFLIRRKRAKKFCYREILGRCTDLPGLPAIHCRPILAAWNVSSTYPTFEQELVEFTLTSASRPLMLSVDAIYFRYSSIIRLAAACFESAHRPCCSARTFHPPGREIAFYIVSRIVPPKCSDLR